ncbi:MULTISPECIES: DUF1129 domain-containing protein [Kitasatospora]|uniref:Transmembrane protein n=2 Tax=Kitasatospora TaxID=2063 RepID=A0ABT1IRV7_9ACTN|nr:DUF1129 domain-containing protein [Kitasatospora paracochleata]MCP2307834.1 hypothetical protein [Kitasatospora paracochleata]
MSTGTGPETDELPGSMADGSETLPELVVPTTSYAVALPVIEDLATAPGVVHERDIRPRRRLRWWQTLPIAVTATFGSLMFAFPLAFGSDSASAMIGMLGLLVTAASVGWGAMAARRAGYKWPGVPRRGSGQRAGWRAIVIYTLIVCLSLALALWRVVHLRG